jgi:hypothetical protein
MFCQDFDRIAKPFIKVQMEFGGGVGRSIPARDTQV